jgi:P pilus assembly chaperone PapD
MMTGRKSRSRRPAIRRLSLIIATAIIATAIVASLGARAALADVSVMPTVLIFDGEAGTKAITVKNTGAKEQIYRVSLLNFRMLPDGRMVVADRPGADEHFATGMVRYSPRELVLAAGGSDVVRFQVAALQPGEYRTHVLVQQVPDVGALQASPFEHVDGVSIDLQAVFGVAVPLIIRQGDLATTVKIADARVTALPDGTPALGLRLERSGPRSVNGTLSLQRGGKEVGLWDGIAVYAPTGHRDLLLPLSGDSIAKLGAGELKATYQEPEDVRAGVTATAIVAPR